MSRTATNEKVSGGSFLIQELEAAALFIPEEFSEEQQMMAQATTDFVNKEIWPNKARFEKKDYDFTFEIMQKAGELGLLGVYVPEQYGGLGMSFNTSMLICDRISGATGSVSTAYGAHTGIGTLPILLYGTDAQKEKYLPKLASGEWIGAYCLTEPGAGSDANSGRTKAVLSEDGKTYAITGQKMWISNAGYAKVFIVFARIENDKNITGFIVERGTEGMTFGEEEHKMGIHASSTRQVFFSDVKVPISNLLGERNGGFKIAMNALNVGRIKLAAACLDANRRVTTEAVKYANERHQFNKPISSFNAIKHKLAEMSTRAWVTESATYRAGQNIEDNIAQLVAEGKTHSEAELIGVEDFAIECAILKVHGSEVATYVADEGVQIFGGMGYSADASMEGAYRDIRIGRIYEGTNEINRMLIVGMLLRKAMKGELDLMSPAMAVAKQLMEIPDFNSPDYSEVLSEEKEVVAKMKKAFLMVAGKAVEKFGMDLDEQQEILMAAADMAIEIYCAESAILRAEKIASNLGAANAAYQIDMATLYLHHATEKLALAAKEAILAISEGDEQRMMLMGLKRFTKRNNNINPVALRRKIADKVIAENKYCF